MTRAVIGIVALDLLYVVVGALVLHALGLLDIRRPRLPDVGFALLVGWALSGVALATIVTLGAPVNVVVVSVVGIALGAAAHLVRWRIPRFDAVAPAARPWHARLVAAAGFAVVAISLAAALVRAVSEGADRSWDAWAFWIAKAKTLAYFGGLDTGPGGFTSFANPEYPPLAPALDAATFAFMGSVAPAYLPIQHWTLTAAFFGALVALLAPRVPAYALWPALALLAAAPGLRWLAASVIADLQLAIVLALSAVLLALHVVERDARLLPVAAVFVAAGALLKTEGLVLSVALVATAALASVGRSRARAVAQVAALGFVPVAALVPWKVWLHANGVPLSSPVFDYGLLLRPAELGERFPRLTYAAEEMLRLLFEPDRWLLLAPAVAVAVVFGALCGSRVGIMVAAWLVAAFLSLASAYWFGTVELYWHVDTSAERVLTSVAVIGGALLPLLLADLARTHRVAPAPRLASRAGGGE